MIEQYFHQDYEQCINGVIMDRIQYTEHVLQQRQTMCVDEIDYRHVLEKKNELFALYYPKGTTVDNLPIEAEVIVYISFENQKIYKIHGQVRLIKGDMTDVDMQPVPSS